MGVVNGRRNGCVHENSKGHKVFVRVGMGVVRGVVNAERIYIGMELLVNKRIEEGVWLIVGRIVWLMRKGCRSIIIGW